MPSLPASVPIPRMPWVNFEQLLLGTPFSLRFSDLQDNQKQWVQMGQGDIDRAAGTRKALAPKPSLQRQTVVVVVVVTA